MKNIIKNVIISAASALLLFSAKTYAAEEVSVRIAPYYTEIDYMSVYNPAVEYPLITYKDITYFPTTYELCTRLGLAVGFDADTGLYITRHDAAYSGDDTKLFGSAWQNSYDTYYTAVIPEYTIHLNGVLIDNAKEEYPILNFRNITYFPMTYRFANEELGFNTEWSPEKGFKMYRERNNVSYAQFGKADNDGVNITFCRNVPVSKTLDDGIVVTTSNFIYSRYKLMYDYGYVKQLGESNRPLEDDYSAALPIPQCDKIFLEDEHLIYLNTKILDLTGRNAHSQYSREYVFDDVSFIHTTVNFGNAPAPYSIHEEYIFVKKNGDIKQLDGWDTKNNLSEIYPDGIGGYYLCSDSYSPTGASRWSNNFACIYRYTPSGEFHEVVVPDTNSITAIDTYGTKFYVKAIYYNASKDTMINDPPTISAINSGYYEIDARTGSIKKLYPYISGKTHLSPDGALYCISVPGTSIRVTELKTGKQLPIK